QPKIGGRFSKEVVNLLKRWIAANKHHPYPTDADMDMLQYQTGLNKGQIVNWFANARRRGTANKVPSFSLDRQETVQQMEIPIPRPGTPAFRSDSQSLNPLERWVESPPENEPASASDIARAVASSPPDDHSQEGSSLGSYRELWNLSSQRQYSRSSARSSASSGVTSRSSRASDSSVHSHTSSQRSHIGASMTHRRRVRKPRQTGKRPMSKAWMQYQCTFCTQTFKTKYDWQRHEKTLHLPIERWLCSPQGPRTVSLVQPPSQLCVFCGQAEPNDAHIESHNYNICHARAPEERMFSRKDHIKQHLILVHNVPFNESAMASWKAPTPDIPSRCGFCNAALHTWTDRVDHLADHFKCGKTMGDWTGDWGFPPDIQKLVENAIPPYLIDTERSTPAPFTAGTHAPYCAPNSTYELLKSELDSYMRNHFEQTGNMPSNDELQLEARRVILAVEPWSDSSFSPSPPSWLRDLIFASNAEMIAAQANFSPVDLEPESHLIPATFSGKNLDRPLFDACPLEAELALFVRGGTTLGTTDAIAIIPDRQLQEAALRIIERLELMSPTPSDTFANWLVKLIFSNTDWLSSFRQRIGLDTSLLAPITVTPIHPLPLHAQSNLPPLSSPSSTVPPPATQNIHIPNFYRHFVLALLNWTTSMMTSPPSTSPSSSNPPILPHIPTDEEIQSQARLILYGDDDPWNTSAADNEEWLQRFKRDAGIL
ncbi:hypothetical protein BU24DRAFT_327014, partial [Aaosphaeria arxii CBS 175.79]